MSDRTFERAVSDWLDDGSDRTPRPAIDAVLLAIKTTPQERGLRVPRRFNLMPAYLRLAAVVAVMALAGIGALAYIGGPPNVGPTVPSASATPLLSPSPAIASPGASLEPPHSVDTTMWIAFSSPVYGYGARRSPGWLVSKGTTEGSAADLALAEPTGAVATFWDHFDPEVANADFRILATSTVVPAGMTEDEWIRAYQAPQVKQAGRSCIPERPEWETTTVDGRTGGIYLGCQFVEAMVFDQGRVYVFALVSLKMSQSAVETDGRLLLEAFLGTVTLEPARAGA